MFNAVIDQKKTMICLTFIIATLTFYSDRGEVTITSFSTFTTYTKC